jgi:hypothetical protein
MNNDIRTYYVVIFSSRRSPYSFCGKNAKRDAERLAKRDGGRVRKMTGAEWDNLCASR